ncbi:hypothetical protein GBF38_004954, partial [Nibea albiflora]
MDRLTLKPQVIDFTALVWHHIVALLLLTHSCGGQSDVTDTPQPIVAVVGDDVILPCHLKVPGDVDAVGSVSSPEVDMSSVSDGVLLECKSKGWYPEPELSWLDEDLPKKEEELEHVTDLMTTLTEQKKNLKEQREKFSSLLQDDKAQIEAIKKKIKDGYTMNKDKKMEKA